MEYFTERANSYSECIQKIRDKYGTKYDILSQKSVRIGGIFGFFGRDGVEMSGVANGLRQNPEELPIRPKPVTADEERERFEAERRRLIDELKKFKGSEAESKELVKKISALEEKVENVLIARGSAEEHPTLERINQNLMQNDFTAGYCRNIIERLRKEFSLEALENYDAIQDTVIQWIGESVKLYQEEEFVKRPQIIALVGPTGVGKTTTIAKLAAKYAIASKNPLSVLMITIDNFRIGAEKQIEAYGNIMEVPVSSVRTHEELRETLDHHIDQVDLILIDTIGKSPRASAELGEMKQILDACGASAEYHLALMANTKASDIGEILQQFESFGYQSVIITKMDETMRFGNVISALADRGKAISYVTTGQQVPKDIQRANVIWFLRNLVGFRINRKKIETLFPHSESEIF